MPEDDLGHLVATVYRMERARLIAGLARLAGDLSRAEETAHEALIAALESWPRTGVPQNPGAWLMTAARRRALDDRRRARLHDRKTAEIAADAAEADEDVVDRALTRLDDDIGDEVLGLIFAACHPVLAPEARVALTLRLVAGLTTAEIARAFLAPEPTIGQRISRAKATLRQSGERFAVPHGADRDRRLASVLEVVYLIFNEGYAATAGEDPIRPSLCAEALRLGRILAARLPDEPEVLGLLALMELQASRLAARVGPDGLPIPLPRQDRARWDRLLIRRGLAALDRAQALGNGPYVLQAALAACHARAPSAEATDWTAIARLYDRLADALPSPVVALNRAIAHSMAFGPETGLAQIAAIEAGGALDGYAPLPAARGDCLLRAGRRNEARAAFAAAAALSRNEAERAFLLARAGACGA